MTRSSFITFVLLSFIGTYNSYMWPSLITGTAGVMEEIISDFNLSQEQDQVTGVQQADYDETDSDSHPQTLVPFSQAMHASPNPVDPTNGKIFDALEIAADQVAIENVPAKQALDEAFEAAQKALNAQNQG